MDILKKMALDLGFLCLDQKLKNVAQNLKGKMEDQDLS